MARDRAARAAIDVSDGLADAVRQLADASGVGARIDAATLPHPPGARRWFEARGDDPVLAAHWRQRRLRDAVRGGAGAPTGRLRAARARIGHAVHLHRHAHQAARLRR